MQEHRKAPQGNEVQQDSSGSESTPQKLLERARAGDPHAIRAVKRRMAARKHHQPERVSFGDNEADTVEGAAPVTADVDAGAIVAGGDTSHNRHGEEETKVEGHDVKEVAEFVIATLDSMKVPHIAHAALAAKLAMCHDLRGVYEVLKGEVTPEFLVELAAKLAKRYAWHQIVEWCEVAGPVLGGVQAGLAYASLSMEYIIGRANEKGRQKAQLNKYAAAWARRFFDDGYAPESLPALDEQMELMNVCAKLGVEDAIKTLEKLGPGAANVRRSAIKHYGSMATARENLALELLKQAGVG